MTTRAFPSLVSLQSLSSLFLARSTSLAPLPKQGRCWYERGNAPYERVQASPCS